MTTRKATAAELFHNLTLAFRQDPQFEYEYAYPADTLALITTPYWELTPEQLAKRLVMIDRGLNESTVDNRRVRLMAMRPEHRYLLTPAYVRLAVVAAYADIAPTWPDTPAAADIALVLWQTLLHLAEARGVVKARWEDLSDVERGAFVLRTSGLLSGAEPKERLEASQRAVTLAILMTFSAAPEGFYKMLVA